MMEYNIFVILKAVKSLEECSRLITVACIAFPLLFAANLVLLGVSGISDTKRIHALEGAFFSGVSSALFVGLNMALHLLQNRI